MSCTTTKFTEYKSSGTMRKKCGNTESVPTLYYFDVAGLAEPIRFCFAYGNIEFTDVRFQFDKWPQYKNLSPSGKAPWLEVDGEHYAESQAILQYAARRAGLIPQNTEHYITAMSIVEMKEAVTKVWYGKVRDEMALSKTVGQDRAAWTAAGERLVRSGALEALAPLDSMIEKTQDQEGHVVGGDLTFADMLIAAFTRIYCELGGNSFDSIVQKALPHMYRCMEMVYALPSIRKWVLHHSYTPELYCDPDSIEGRILRIALSVADVKYVYKGHADKARLSVRDEDLAVGLRPCCLWINSRYSLMPVKSNTNLLGMWSLVDLIYNMTMTWGTSTEAERNTLRRVNQSIMKTQSREGFCIGHTMTFADIAAAAFYDYYMAGHSVGVDAADIQGFRNAHRVVYQIPEVPADMLKYEPTPTLVYYNFAGRGEAIRLLCYATGIKFNDVRVSLATWLKSEYKKQSPNGKLPYMQVGDITLSEQSAILTYLAARRDLLPSTLSGRYIAQAIESSSHDLAPILMEVVKTDAAGDRTAILKAGLNDFLNNLDSLVKMYKPANSMPQYVVEDRLTYADFLIAGTMAGFPEELQLDMTQWTSLKAIYDNVVSIPQVMSYRDQRGPQESLLSNWKGLEKLTNEQNIGEVDVKSCDVNQNEKENDKLTN